MISGLPPSADKFLFDISQIQKRNERAQRQITSGLKLATPSDSPDDLTRLMEARAGLERVHQNQLNLGRVKTETDTAEKALDSAAKILDKARALATQGASGHQSAQTRQHVADELGGLLERLVAAASTAVEGRYIFSGDNDQVAPYTLDPAVPSGVSAYQGASSTRQIADASGTLFSAAFSADVIFDSANPDENVFLAVNGMRRALLAVDNPPNPPDPTIPGIEVALQNLGKASTFLNQKLAQYGAIQNRVQEASDLASRMEISLREQVVNIEEADLAEAALELTQSGTVLEAAFSARARSPRRSLFDYLG